VGALTTTLIWFVVAYWDVEAAVTMSWRGWEMGVATASILWLVWLGWKVGAVKPSHEVARLVLSRNGSGSDKHLGLVCEGYWRRALLTTSDKS
jgi:hypothetical protein